MRYLIALWLNLRLDYLAWHACGTPRGIAFEKGTGTIHVDTRDIRLEWDVRMPPLSRRPRVILIVNRFSGEAEEIFAMLKPDNHGPENAYGGRSGQCAIHARKL